MSRRTFMPKHLQGKEAKKSGGNTRTTLATGTQPPSSKHLPSAEARKILEGTNRLKPGMHAC